MKALFIIIALCLPSIASAQDPYINEVKSDQADTIELQIQKFEHIIIDFEAANSQFETAIAKYEANQKMKEIHCMGYRLAITEPLAKLRAFSADLKKMSGLMTESQLIRFSRSENVLSTLSPDHPLCVGT